MMHKIRQHHVFAGLSACVEPELQFHRSSSFTFVHSARSDVSRDEMPLRHIVGIALSRTDFTVPSIEFDGQEGTTFGSNCRTKISLCQVMKSYSFASNSNKAFINDPKCT